MELTLTGASLNSDHGNISSTSGSSGTRQRPNSNSNSNSTSLSQPQCKSSQCKSSHCHSNLKSNLKSNSNSVQAKDKAGTAHNHNHGHGHSNDKKKCCENHNHNHNHSHSHSHGHGGHNHNHNHAHANPNTNANSNTNANPYVDVRSIPKEKLTSNPPVLMNAVIASVRGRGSFDTFCYLINLVLDHEKSNAGSASNSATSAGSAGAGTNSGSGSAMMKEESINLSPVPMKWGTPPPITVSVSKSNSNVKSNANISVNNECQSCLNNYTNEGHTLAHWCAKRINDGTKYLQYLVDHVPYIHLNLPSKDAVGMTPIHWSCTEGSIPNVAFLLDHFHFRHGGGGQGGSGGNSGGVSNGVGGGNSVGVGSVNNATTAVSKSSPLEATDSSTNTNTTNNNNMDIINTLDASKCTPLLIASQYGHADLVAFLIKRGANPYAIDNAGDTAFHWAAYKGSVPVCALLLHLHCYHQRTGSDGGGHGGGNGGSHDGDGHESGHGSGLTSIAKNTNIHNKYDDYESGDLYGYMDLQDNFGQCPLHLASLRGNIDVVSYLLEEAEQFVERKLYSRRMKAKANTHTTSNSNAMGMAMTMGTGTNVKSNSGGGSNDGIATTVDVETGLSHTGNENKTSTSTSTTESQSLLANDYNNKNNNNNKPSFNVEHYPATLLNMKDKNDKTPIELAIKKKQKPTELLLRKYMDKHNYYNQSSAFGKLKMSLMPFFSFQNWLLWMGLMSEGGGRPPKFILWFVVGNLFLASCIEAFVYAPSIWMKVLGEEYLNVQNMSFIEHIPLPFDLKSHIHFHTSEEMVRLSSDEGYMALHVATWISILLTWTTLYLVNQVDPGILITSSALSLSPSSMGMGMGMGGDIANGTNVNVTNLRAASSISERVTNWVQLLIRRLCSFVPGLSSSFFARDGNSRYSSIGGSSSNNGGSGTSSAIGCGVIAKCTSALSSWLCCCFGIGNENKRIRREMHSLSIELRRKYDDKLESFASSADSNNGTGTGAGTGNCKQEQLCHSCHIVRPLRSKHCRVLNRCILLFDHHCPFVGTTIGLYNYKYFYMFVVFFTTADILFTTTGFLYWKHGMTAAAAAISTDAAKESMEIGTLMIIIYFSLYTIMAGGLSVYHTQLIYNNLTTNEHQNLHKYNYLKKANADGSISMHNPFNKGFLWNLKSRFFPGRDSYVLEDVVGADEHLHVDGKKKASVVEMVIPSSNKKSDDNGGKENMV